MPPPSSGGITVLQIMQMLEQFDMASLGPGSLKATHLIAEPAVSPLLTGIAISPTQTLSMFQ